jgi:hypothetical protein
MLRQKRVGFGEHVQRTCDVQGLHTIKYDNGDFHFVTFIHCKHVPRLTMLDASLQRITQCHEAW